MPKTGLRQEFKLETRNRYTTLDCEVGFTVEGKELPNMEVLGRALETAMALIQSIVKESYQVVPERPADPWQDGQPAQPEPAPTPNATVPPVPNPAFQGFK